MQAVAEVDSWSVASKLQVGMQWSPKQGGGGVSFERLISTTLRSACGATSYSAGQVVVSTVLGYTPWKPNPCNPKAEVLALHDESG